MTYDLKDAALEALAHYYDQVYDGEPGPDYVFMLEEALGALLAPDGDARDRAEAVEKALREYEGGPSDDRD